MIQTSWLRRAACGTNRRAVGAELRRDDGGSLPGTFGHEAATSCRPPALLVSGRRKDSESAFHTGPV